MEDIQSCKLQKVLGENMCTHWDHIIGILARVSPGKMKLNWDPAICPQSSVYFCAINNLDPPANSQAFYQFTFSRMRRRRRRRVSVWPTLSLSSFLCKNFKLLFCPWEVFEIHFRCLIIHFWVDVESTCNSVWFVWFLVEIGFFDLGWWGYTIFVKWKCHLKTLMLCNNLSQRLSAMPHFLLTPVNMIFASCDDPAPQASLFIRIC